MYFHFWWKMVLLKNQNPILHENGLSNTPKQYFNIIFNSIRKWIYQNIFVKKWKMAAPLKWVSQKICLSKWFLVKDYPPPPSSKEWMIPKRLHILYLPLGWVKVKNTGIKTEACIQEKRKKYIVAYNGSCPFQESNGPGEEKILHLKNKRKNMCPGKKKQFLLQLLWPTLPSKIH